MEKIESPFDVLWVVDDAVKGTREILDALRIPKRGCLVRSRLWFRSKGEELSLSESMIFVPGVKIEDITDSDGNTLRKKLVSDCRKY